ncbi:hypothetical protein CYMTET_49836 [Cymbomonas tetramitiformis]|uniref:Uncharacterized protein n=1 Tax=Cymbomonas tetramitiformis TaxID=36881 RepID=A0AAE0EUB5_9CHLO|nr:hypothetical protein CYMTET_49836 [Cymbomonas tetramitiformis]
MGRATARLAEFRGLSRVASGERKRPWEAAVDLSQLPGSDRLELARNDSDGKDKGLRKQYLETQHHFVAHSASQSALADAKKDLEGVDLPESVALALEFLSETAEKGVARAKASAKILALVSNKGPEGHRHPLHLTKLDVAASCNAGTVMSGATTGMIVRSHARLAEDVAEALAVS